MPRKERIVNVAGVFDVDISLSEEKLKGAKAAFQELYNKIKPFFQGSEDDKFKEISEMFRNAKLKNKILSFSFPSEIKEYYWLKGRYKIRLSLGEATIFSFKEGLQSQLNKRNCDIGFRKLSDEEKDATSILLDDEIFKVRNLHFNAKKIVISKWDGVFGINIDIIGGRRLKMSGCLSLIEAISFIKRNVFL